METKNFLPFHELFEVKSEHQCHLELTGHDPSFDPPGEPFRRVVSHPSTSLCSGSLHHSVEWIILALSSRTVPATNNPAIATPFELFA